MSGVNGLADAAVDGLVAEDASVDVDDLQGGFAFIEDDPVAVAEESEGRVGPFGSFGGLGGEDKAEARGVVAGLRGKGIGWHLQQVDVGTSHIINKVQITHLHALGIDRNLVSAVLLGLEIQRHFALAVAEGNGVFLAALRDINIGVLLAEVELAQLTAFVEGDDGFVQQSVAAGVGLG